MFCWFRKKISYGQLIYSHVTVVITQLENLRKLIMSTAEEITAQIGMLKDVINVQSANLDEISSKMDAIAVLIATLKTQQGAATQEQLDEIAGLIVETTVLASEAKDKAQAVEDKADADLVA